MFLKFPKNYLNLIFLKLKKTENDEKRTKKVIDLISKKESYTMGDKITKLCSEYADIFAMPDDKLSVNNFYEQNLRAKDNEPVFVKNYRLPHTQKQEINRQVQKLLDDDLIVHSFSFPKRAQMVKNAGECV